MDLNDATTNNTTGSGDTPASFEVKFEGPGIEPKKMPLRAMTTALSALQDLASWRDSYDSPKVPPEKAISLVKVRGGSVSYDCVSQSPEEATANFRRVGRFILTPGEYDDDDLGAVLTPLKSLSKVAKACDCTVSVWTVGTAQERLMIIDSGVYERVAENAFIVGESTIIGEIVRAGGATNVRCVMRVPGRQRLLYCDVASDKLARRLGQHLYRHVVATGKATWLHRSWRLCRFEVTDFAIPALGDADEAIRELRQAGLSHWDNVDDPESLLRGVDE